MARPMLREDNAANNANEQDPLLASSAASDNDPEIASPPVNGHSYRKATPLPLLQLLILAMVRLAEPIGLSQVFPYVNQMIEDLGIAGPEDVGYYSGMVDSSFSFAQLLTIYFWSSLSNRIGRKPVILMGTAGAALSSICFGFSRSLPAMLFSRSLAGCLSGNVAVISSMLSEITDETNQGKAFPLIGVTWAIGNIIGPMIGGNLSNPMNKWPEMFKNYPLFQAYPYLLPCMASSSISVFAIIMCSCFVRETLPSKVAAQRATRERKRLRNPFYSSTSASTPVQQHPPTTRSASNVSAPMLIGAEDRNRLDDPKSGHQAAAKTTSVFYLLSKPHIRAVLASGFMLSLLNVGTQVVFVLYSYTRVDLGGMGRSPAQIGYALAGSGTVGAFLSLVFFPYVQRRFNNRRLYTFFSAFWTLGFILMPIGNLAARLPMGGDEAKKDAVVWAAIVLILIPVRIATNVFPLNMIIVKTSVDSADQVGSMFGLQQTCSSIARGISPTFVSSLFAISIERQILGGQFVWLVMFTLSLVAIPLSMRVRDVPPPRWA